MLLWNRGEASWPGSAGQLLRLPRGETEGVHLLTFYIYLGTALCIWYTGYEGERLEGPCPHQSSEQLVDEDNRQPGTSQPPGRDTHKYKAIAANVGVKFSVIAFTTYGGWGEEFRNKYVEPLLQSRAQGRQSQRRRRLGCGMSSTARRLLSVMSPP
eukprot:scaffold1240_cov101-Isochrysis_galbana.AAC.3